MRKMLTLISEKHPRRTPITLVSSVEEAEKYLDKKYGNNLRYERTGLNIAYFSEAIRSTIRTRFVLAEPD